jgi:hypothetical protein
VKREHDRRSQENPSEAELQSKFETVYYEMEANSEDQQEKPEIIRRATTKHQHKYRRPRRPRSPARITVTTTRGGGIGSAGESIDRVTGKNGILGEIIPFNFQFDIRQAPIGLSHPFIELQNMAGKERH